MDRSLFSAGATSGDSDEAKHPWPRFYFFADWHFQPVLAAHAVRVARA